MGGAVSGTDEVKMSCDIAKLALAKALVPVCAFEKDVVCRASRMLMGSGAGVVIAARRDAAFLVA